MITSMLCWGSWANARRLTTGYAFSLFYWDYVLGIAVAALCWGLTFGSLNGGTNAFLQNPASGVILTIVSGLLMGTFYPFVARSTLGEHSLGPYAVAFVFALGVMICSLSVNTWLMGTPLLVRSQHPSRSIVRLEQVGISGGSWHIWGEWAVRSGVPERPSDSLLLAQIWLARLSPMRSARVPP